nr:immunoglobulin light chain junction region [Macaca mulatta]MOW39252.1 immunoglobulin light chain junction region [Macaca mulatta]
WQQGSSYPWTF